MKNSSRKCVTELALRALLFGLTVFAGLGSAVYAFDLQPNIGKTILGRTGSSNSGVSDFSVSFTDCVESIGVGLVSTVDAQELVPAGFILAGSGQPVTPLVVRTARCSISVNGHGSRVGEIVQIGAVIIPPDGTGDINNYTMFYYTSDLRLALRLRLAGVNSQFVPTIGYHIGNHNSFFVRVPFPGYPRFTLTGTVNPSPQPPGSFISNWWQKTSRGNVKMNTNVPVINIGGANLTLTTNPNGPLGQLIGGDTLGFPIVQQFNTFTNAQMSVNTLTP